MCMIDACGEWCEVYVRENRTARKEWRCDECSATIPPGATYAYAKGLYEGRWDEYHTCSACDEGPCAWLTATCGGWLHHGVQEDLEEHWTELAGVQPPVERLTLGRLIVAMRRRSRSASVTRG